MKTIIEIIEFSLCVLLIYAAIVLLPVYADYQDCIRGKHAHYKDEPCFEMWHIFRFKNKRNPTDVECRIKGNVFFCEDSDLELE